MSKRFARCMGAAVAVCLHLPKSADPVEWHLSPRAGDILPCSGQTVAKRERLMSAPSPSSGDSPPSVPAKRRFSNCASVLAAAKG